MARNRKLTTKYAGFPMFKVGTSGDTFPMTSPFTTEFTGLDGLALDLQFAADKTLTARKGPTPVFTRASSGRFVGSDGLIQSAGNNVARFDHDPVTLACKGLLIEESRTNASLYSGAIIVNTGWAGSEITSVVDGTGPDGNNAYTITETSATAIHTIANTGGLVGIGATSVVSGTVYTGSIFIKKATGSVDWIQLTLGSGGFGTSQYANFNINTGAVGNSAGLASGTTPRIENYGNGWYRCSISVAATATTLVSLNTVLAFINNNNNGTTRAPSYAGNIANKVLVNLCQFETGSFPTSYIPTTTASVIRSADVCSISGSDFSGFYNQTAGTALVKTIGGDSVISRDLFRFSGRIAPIDSISISGYSRFLAAEVSIVTDNSQQLVHFSSFSRGLERLSLAYAQNSAAYCRNGTITATDNSVTTSSSITQLSLGEQGINGCITSFRYYKKRLPNAKLQALTV